MNLEIVYQHHDFVYLQVSTQMKTGIYKNYRLVKYMKLQQYSRNVNHPGCTILINV